MKFQSFIISLAFIFFIFFGCKSNPVSAQGGSIQDIFPLKVGDSWTYRQKDFDTSGAVGIDTTGVISVNGEETYNGFHAYHYTIDSGFVLLYYSGSDLYSIDPSSTFTPEIILHYPMNIGESRVKDTTLNGTSFRETVTLLQNSEAVITVAGTFQAVHFLTVDAYLFPNIADTVSIVDTYYAPGVGLVLAKNYEFINNKRYVSRSVELQSYVVK